MAQQKKSRRILLDEDERQVDRMGVRLNKRTVDAIVEYCIKNKINFSQAARQGFDLLLTKQSRD